ncbi:hypothetical protein AXA84_0452 [Candidatus Phytoplasma oryzae]|uniref:Uncharacterized protein n=1 Tax=Candidatus Phytoplasma oryzae TaxID=203274 RepID=A0A139JQ26_9MOLU|nr:hypothetical protein AXA84_0452 [Candidatus Phytoplasma oryzae]
MRKQHIRKKKEKANSFFLIKKRKGTEHSLTTKLIPKEEGRTLRETENA